MKTLEEILNELGSKKPFLKNVKYIDDMKEPFTNQGSMAYEKLTDILYCVGELTNTDMNNIVEELDKIANEDKF